MANKSKIEMGTSHKEEDAIMLNKIKYYIRFTPKHAEHIWDNYDDAQHKIKHKEILTMIKKSPIFIPNGNYYVILGKHKNKIYNTFVEIRKNCIEVKTSYRCSNPEYIKNYRDAN